VQSRSTIRISVSVMPRFVARHDTVKRPIEASAFSSNAPAVRFTVVEVAGPENGGRSIARHPTLVLIVPD